MDTIAFMAFFGPVLLYGLAFCFLRLKKGIPPKGTPGNETSTLSQFLRYRKGLNFNFGRILFLTPLVLILYPYTLLAEREIFLQNHFVEMIVVAAMVMAVLVKLVREK